MITPQLIDSFIINTSPKRPSVQARRRICLAAVLALLLACSGPDPVDQLAAGPALQRSVIKSGDFTLATLSPTLPAQVHALRVYLGSDGRPWHIRHPTADPTGSRSLSAELMVQDYLPALYLGRPCYHGTAMRAPCEPGLWTSGRYSETVITAMAGALDQLIRRYCVRELTLVGYSGGGVLALLVGARLATDRPEKSLRLAVITVATNLDIQQWTRFHGHLPLDESLNPVVAVPSPAPFRQIHLAGRADQVVPVATIQRYVETHPEATVWYLDEFTHVTPWVRQWPELLEKIDGTAR